MNNYKRRLMFWGMVCAGLFLMLLGVSMLTGTVRVARAQGDEGQNPSPAMEPTSDNSYCAICHSQPGRSMTLKDGSVLDLYVSPAVIADSVHGTTEGHQGLGCVDCHGESVFPHNGPSPESAREYTIKASESCSNCHNELLADSAHLEAIDAGNLQAATCVDCHRAHDTPPTENHPALTAAVCSDCHTTTYEEWVESPHADMGNLGCAVCHLPHGQQLRIENTTALCLNCHKVPSDIYVHEKHLNSEYDVSCASCHMSYDPDIKPMSGGKEPTDHRMVVQTTSCNQCHEELETSGVWAQLVNTNEEVVIERDALRQQIADLEGQVSEHNVSEKSGSDVNYEQLIQGLIVGLGLGVIVLLITVPRLSRNNNNHIDDNGHDHE